MIRDATDSADRQKQTPEQDSPDVEAAIGEINELLGDASERPGRTHDYGAVEPPDDLLDPSVLFPELKPDKKGR